MESPLKSIFCRHRYGHQVHGKVTIRKGNKADIDTLISLLKILFAIEEDFTFNKTKQRRGLELMLDNNRGTVLVAQLESMIIGMCTGQLMISTTEGGYSVMVEDVIVLPEYRGKGVGRILITELCDWARKRDCKRLQLLADGNNLPALQFYKHLGWQTTELICLRQK